MAPAPSATSFWVVALAGPSTPPPARTTSIPPRLRSTSSPLVRRRRRLLRPTTPSYLINDTPHRRYQRAAGHRRPFPGRSVLRAGGRRRFLALRASARYSPALLSHSARASPLTQCSACSSA